MSSLRNDVIVDIEYLESQDSLFSIIKSNAEIAITLFYNARSVKDFIEINTLNFQKWDVIKINKNAYTEMLNTGNLYTIKNKIVKNTFFFIL